MRLFVLVLIGITMPLVHSVHGQPTTPRIHAREIITTTIYHDQAAASRTPPTTHSDSPMSPSQHASYHLVRSPAVLPPIKPIMPHIKPANCNREGTNRTQCLEGLNNTSEGLDEMVDSIPKGHLDLALGIGLGLGLPLLIVALLIRWCIRCEWPLRDMRWRKCF